MKRFKVRGLSHILIEGYCTINQDYDHKSSKWTYSWKTEDKDFLKNWKKHRHPNPDYDPDAKPDKKPEWCEGHVCIACLRDKGVSCPHFAYSEAQKKINKKFRKMIRKHYGLVKKHG